MSALREFSAELVAVECGQWGDDAAKILCEHNAKAALRSAREMRDAARRTRSESRRAEFLAQMRAHALRWRMYGRDVLRLRVA